MSSGAVGTNTEPRVDKLRQVVSALVLLSAGAAGLSHAEQVETAPCQETVVKGRVERGEAFEAVFADDLVFRLTAESHAANPQGWTIQVTPRASPTADYLMVATPPYRFSNPRYVDTGYGMTAAAALAWTPREFAFVVGAQEYRTATESVGVLLWPASHTQSEIERAQTALNVLPTNRGRLWIEDGSASPPDDQRPQGEIEWISFRAELCVPESAAR